MFFVFNICFVFCDEESKQQNNNDDDNEENKSKIFTDPPFVAPFDDETNFFKSNKQFNEYCETVNN